MPPSDALIISRNIISTLAWMFCVVSLASRHLRTPTTARAFAFAPTFGRNRVAVSNTNININTILAFSSAATTATTITTVTLTPTSSTTTRLRSTLGAPTMETSNATDSTPVAAASYPIEMTEDEKYLFDLNGYLIVRGVLTPEEVADANAAIDRHADEMVERSDTDLRNAKQGTKYFGQGPGRMDLGRCLEWGEKDSKVFKSILAHPLLVPVFHGILGKGYRMDHMPMVLAQNKGSEGFQLHGGTIDCSSGAYNPYLAYHCHHGSITTALLGCNVMLRDHNPGDGGFCIVPGSHKSNFKMPKGMVDGEKYEEFVVQPATKAGDVVLFSEGTVHGAKVSTT
uniref:Phytanoyl-CoA dioxygenase n=1 Tax=Pseudo-nitzschia australis TaxID=44445 RepID=A0A7S4A995_9STRA